MTMPRNDEGFTLLETLIAFAILSVGLALSLQTVALATRNIERGRLDDLTAELATSLIAEKLPEMARAKELRLTGQDGDIQWRITVLDVENGARPRIAHIEIQPGVRSAMRSFVAPIPDLR